MSNKKGIISLAASVVLFAIMATLVRTVQDVGGLHTVFFRFLISLMSLSVLALTGVFSLSFNNHKLLLLRGFTGGIATFLFYTSIQKLGVGLGTLIVYSYPLFAAFFSALFLKERVSVQKWFAILWAFGGFILLFYKPELVSVLPGKYELMALGGAMLSAISVVLVRKLHQTDSTYAIFFAQAIMGSVLFITPASLVPVNLSTSTYLILLMVGFIAVGAQLLMTNAYKHVPVATAAPTYMLVPVISLVIGWMLFNERLSTQQILGSLIVLGGTVWVTRSK